MEDVYDYNSYFETYPNQKRISIQREEVKNAKEKGRSFLTAYQDNLKEAMNTLTPAAFEVYICLLFNTNGYQLRFSPENIRKMTGLCKDTIRKAMAQMEKKGYIVGKDVYNFVFYENRMLKD